MARGPLRPAMLHERNRSAAHAAAKLRWEETVYLKPLLIGALLASTTIAPAMAQANTDITVVLSEELDELFELSDRLHVIARGRLSPSVPIAAATVEKIGEWMSGLWHEDVQAQLAGMANEVNHA